MIPFISAAELRHALEWPALMDALAAAFRTGANTPVRHVHKVDEAANTVLLLMPAWQQEQMGVKLVTVAPDNPARGVPTVHSIYVLYDTRSGAPLAMLDGEELTLRRTAAASALASRSLSRPDSGRLLVVGAGSLAAYMAVAHCQARPIRQVTVWGRQPQKLQDCVRRIQALGLPEGVRVQVATDLAQACSQADIISAATTSTVPLVRHDWLAPGTHVDLVGGFKPDMREADDALMSSAALFVDTYAGALAEAGDLRQPIDAGLIKPEHVRAELSDLVTGRHPGRESAHDITVFKSVGSAIEDLAAARLAWASNALPSRAAR